MQTSAVYRIICSQSTICCFSTTYITAHFCSYSRGLPIKGICSHCPIMHIWRMLVRQRNKRNAQLAQSPNLPVLLSWPSYEKSHRTTAPHALSCSVPVLYGMIRWTLVHCTNVHPIYIALKATTDDNIFPRSCRRTTMKWLSILACANVRLQSLFATEELGMYVAIEYCIIPTADTASSTPHEKDFNLLKRSKNWSRLWEKVSVQL